MNASAPTSCLIIGMGGISRQMLGVLRTKPWFQCAGIVDVSDAGLAAGQEVAGLPESALFKDLGRALAELKPEAALINTPSELHVAQSKQCIEAGCHVLVAKPVTNDFALRDPRPSRPHHQSPLRAPAALGHHLGGQLGRAGSWTEVQAAGS